MRLGEGQWQQRRKLEATEPSSGSLVVSKFVVIMHHSWGGERLWFVGALGCIR